MSSSPAFPTVVINLDAETVAEAMEEGGEEKVKEFAESMGDVGLSMRDYFASEALKGYMDNLGGLLQREDFSKEKLAERSYEVADAMLSERERGGE